MSQPDTVVWVGYGAFGWFMGKHCRHNASHSWRGGHYKVVKPEQVIPAPN
jgi:hypothetical protein